MARFRYKRLPRFGSGHSAVEQAESSWWILPVDDSTAPSASGLPSHGRAFPSRNHSTVCISASPSEARFHSTDRPNPCSCFLSCMLPFRLGVFPFRRTDISCRATATHGRTNRASLPLVSKPLLSSLFPFSGLTAEYPEPSTRFWGVVLLLRPAP